MTVPRTESVGGPVHQYRGVEVCVMPEPDGGFVGFVPALRGVVSQGETEDETVANVREALVSVLQSYRADGEPVPWTDKDQLFQETHTGRRHWVTVPLLAVMLAALLTLPSCASLGAGLQRAGEHVCERKDELSQKLGEGLGLLGYPGQLAHWFIAFGLDISCVLIKTPLDATGSLVGDQVGAVTAPFQGGDDAAAAPAGGSAGPGHGK